MREGEEEERADKMHVYSYLSHWRRSSSKTNFVIP